jgi:recombination protein RecA
MTISTLDQPIQQLIKQLARQLGKSTLMRLSDAKHLQIATLSTAISDLDVVLDGGLPKGRIIESFGPESAGKTTLALHAIAQAQQAGGTAAFIDAEHALDPVYARALGVDINKLLVSQPNSGERALSVIESLVESGALALSVVDSVAALPTQDELNSEMGDYTTGLHSKLMSKALRRITARLNAKPFDCILVFTNQLRYQIGVTYGSPETTTGGRALRFYASMRLEVRRIQTLKRGLQEYGIKIKVKAAKNKVAPPFRSVELDLHFGKGFQQGENVPMNGLREGA